MVLTETIQYITVFAVTIVFSAFALAITNRLAVVLKVIAGLSWFTLSLTQFFYFGGSQVIAAPLSLMFMGIGLFFCFSIVTDFRTAKEKRIWRFDEE